MHLTTLLDMAVEAFGDRVVMGRRNGGLCPREVREQARGGAQELRSAGATALLYLGENGPSLAVALFAASYAGVPLVPVNYRLGRSQMLGVLERHPAAIAVAEEMNPVLAEAGITRADVASWGSRAAGDPPDPPDAGAPAAIVYTSGTTSAPKGVVLRHAELANYVLTSVMFDSAADEVALTSVPPYHVAGVAGVLTNLYAGRRTVILERFSAEAWLDLARAEGVTSAMVVPTMLARIVAHDGDRSAPSLRRLAHGGSAMPRSVITEALALWPHVEFTNAYGLTETSSTVTVLGPDDHRAALASDDPQVRARLGSVGKPIPGVEIEIRDDDGRPVAGEGTGGRVFVRGDQVAQRYQDGSSVVGPEGYLDTRDDGCIENGHLFVQGRRDDTIIRGAENIAPREIEEVLRLHGAVGDAAVVGVPDPAWGQRIEAAVELLPGRQVSTEELRSFVRSQLRSSKTPGTDRRSP